MKNYAIISEFNPFHKGHHFLTECCRKNGATHITAIMSGNYVQRGDVAIMPKHRRTEMALKSGVDLVLELPLPFALSNAQVFARGGVQIANAMGCTDSLAFGSECGNIEELNNICDIISRQDFKQQFKEIISTGISYPNALSKTIAIIGNSQQSEIISSPNNTLGIEYINALRELKSNIKPVTFTRVGDAHNSLEIFSDFASASNIRKLILNGESFRTYVPESCVDTIVKAIDNGEIAQLKNNSRGVLLKLRELSIDKLSDISDVNEGLENRIYSAVLQSTNLLMLIEKIKTKRYTHARIRRIIMSYLLGIVKEYTKSPVPYIRVLGFNEKGAEVLKEMKKNATLPIVTKLTNLPSNFSDYAEKMLNLEIDSTDIYYTFTEIVKPCGEEYRNGVVVVK